VEIPHASTSVVRFLNRKKAAERYGISPEALGQWLKKAQIAAPPRGGFFSDKDMKRLDTFYVVTEFYRVPQVHYRAIVLDAGGVNKYFAAKYSGITFYECLTKHLPLEAKNNQVVQDLIWRLENDKSA